MFLFGPPNIEKLKAQRDVKGVIKALGYEKDANVRRAAAEVLGELQDASAIERLIAVRKDSGEQRYVRMAAASALAKIGDTRAVKSLIAAVENSDVDVRKAAARSLVQIYQGQDLSPQVKQYILAQRYEIQT